MPTTTVGTIQVDFRTNIAKFIKKLKGFGYAIDRVGDKLASVSKNLATLGAAGAAAATAVIVKNTEAIRELSLASEQLGMSASGLDKWTYAAQDFGITQDDLLSGLGDFSERISEAAEGTGEGAEALERLGLSAANLKNLGVEEAAYAVSDAMAGITNASDRARISIQLFGGEVGKKMAPLMAEGSKAIKDAADEAERLGLTISDTEVEKVNAMGEGWKDITNLMTAMGRRLTVDIAPVVTDIANRIMDWWKEGDNAQKVLKNITEGARLVYKFAVNIWHGFKSMAAAAKLVTQVVITGLFKAIGYVSDKVRSLIGFFESLGTIFEKTGDVFQAALEDPIGAVKLTFISFIEFMNDKVIGMLQSFAGVADYIGLDGPINKAINSVNAFGSTLKAVKQQALRDSQGIATAIEDLGASVDAAMAVDESDFNAMADAAWSKVSGLQAEITATNEAWFESNAAAAQLWDTINLKANERAAQSVAMHEMERAQSRETAEVQAQSISFVTQAYQEGLKEREKFSKMSWSMQTKTALGSLESITAGAASQNKTMFNIHKTAATANAVISGIEGVSRTLGAYPYPINIPLAGLQAAAAALQVQKIQSTSFGGGGSVSSPSGGGAAPAAGGAGSPNTAIEPAEGVATGAQVPGAAVVRFETVPTPGGEAVMVDSLYNTLRYMRENNIPIPAVPQEQ